MTTELKQATTKEVSSHNTVKIDGIQVANTRNGEAVFMNTNYVSQKLISILTNVLNSDEYTLSTGENYGHGVYNVIFRIDGMPLMANDDGTFEAVPWVWVESSKSIVCNIKRCVEIAFEQCLDDHEDYRNTENMNVRALIWQHLLAGFLHECHHAETFMDDAMKMLTDKKAMAVEEEKADEHARMSLYELAKTIDIEMDLGNTIESMAEEAWNINHENLHNVPENKLTVKELMFLECQEYMRSTGDLWYMPTEPGDAEHEPKIINNFKELMHFMSGDPLDDEAWNIPIDKSHVETRVTNNQPSMEDANGNIHPEYNNPGQGADCMYQEVTQPVQGFQGAQPQQHVQQNMGYAPQTLDTTYQQDIQNYQATATQTIAAGYQGNPDAIAANATQQSFQQQTNMPAPPPGTPGQPATQAPNHQYNPAANNGTNVGQNQEVQVGAYEFPATALDVNQFQVVVQRLYHKIFAQVFDSCGFNPMNGPGQPYFMQSAKIVEPIMLDEEEKKIVKFMECYDTNGKIQLNAPVGDWISGRFVDKAKNLPGFVLTMSNMQGQRIVRKFIPQNPWKTNASGGYSQTAQLAQQGTKIMWIIDPAEKDKQFATRILGGQLQSNRNGQWIDIC
jgi:hypothetical protein